MKHIMMQKGISSKVGCTPYILSEYLTVYELVYTTPIVPIHSLKVIIRLN